MVRRLLRTVILLLVRLSGLPGAYEAAQKARQPLPTAPRILLLRPDHLGDLVLTTPVLHALKTRAPAAHITMMVGPWSSEVVARHPDIDRLLSCPFPGFQRAVQKPLAPYMLLFSVAKQLRRGNYDLAINLRPDFWWGAALLYLARVPRRVGYALLPGKAFLTHALPFQSPEHATVSNLRLASAGLQALGSTPLEEPYTPERYPLQFHPNQEEQQWVGGRLQKAGVPAHAPLIVMHAGSGAAVKLWRTAAWAAIANALPDLLTWSSIPRIILTGSKSERPMLEQIAAGMTTAPLLVTDATVGQLAALLGRACLVIGIDSGPPHLAVAQGTPTVHIFGPADPRIFGPWGTPEKHVVVAATQRCPTCSTIPCSRLDIPDEEMAEHPCVRLIKEQSVLAAIKSLLEAQSTMPGTVERDNSNRLSILEGEMRTGVIDHALSPLDTVSQGVMNHARTHFIHVSPSRMESLAIKQQNNADNTTAIDDNGYRLPPDSRKQLRKIGIRTSKRLLRACIYLALSVIGGILRLGRLGQQYPPLAPSNFSPKRILVIRLDLIGDLVLSLTVVRVLKRTYPGAEIDLLATPSSAKIVTDDPDIATIIPYDPNIWRRPKALLQLKNWREAQSLLHRLHARHYDLAISVFGNWAAVLSVLSAARRRVGFGREGYPGFMTDNVRGRHWDPHYHKHEVDYCLELAHAAGATPDVDDRAPRLFVSVEAQRELESLLRQVGIQPGKPLVACHVSSNNGYSKRWPLPYWAALIDHLVREDSMQIVFTGAPDDLPLIESVLERVHEREGVFNLAGKTSLTQLAALLQRADLLITGDSGPMHIAAAVGTPLIAMHGPTDPALTGPVSPTATILTNDIWCRPCYNAKDTADCRFYTTQCMKNIPPSQVIEVVRKKLSKSIL